MKQPIPVRAEAYKAAYAILKASKRSTTLTEKEFLSFCNTEKIWVNEAKDAGFMEDRADVWEEIQADSYPTDGQHAWMRGEFE